MKCKNHSKNVQEWVPPGACSFYYINKKHSLRAEWRKYETLLRIGKKGNTYG